MIYMPFQPPEKIYRAFEHPIRVTSKQPWYLIPEIQRFSELTRLSLFPTAPRFRNGSNPDFRHCYVARPALWLQDGQCESLSGGISPPTGCLNIFPDKSLLDLSSRSSLAAGRPVPETHPALRSSQAPGTPPVQGAHPRREAVHSAREGGHPLWEGLVLSWMGFWEASPQF